MGIRYSCSLPVRLLRAQSPSPRRPRRRCSRREIGPPRTTPAVPRHQAPSGMNAGMWALQLAHVLPDRGRVVSTATTIVRDVLPGSFRYRSSFVVITYVNNALLRRCAQTIRSLTRWLDRANENVLKVPTCCVTLPRKYSVTAPGYVSEKTVQIQGVRFADCCYIRKSWLLMK